MHLNKNELDIGYFLSSGPGGQHRDKKMTGVRIIHLPTGITAVYSARRSRKDNLNAAKEIIIKKLKIFYKKKKKRIPTKIPIRLIQKRLDQKRKRGKIKKLRSNINIDDY